MFYMIVLIMSFNISFWWWVWLMMEFMNWLMMLFINNTFLMLSFMMWQSISSLGFLVNFIYLNKFSLICFFFLLKMGLPPFHYWFWSFSLLWSWKSFSMFMFIHKYTPVMILSNFMNNLYWSWFMILPLLSFMMFFLIFSVKNLIFSMAVSDSSWMMLSLFVSLKMMLIYFLLNMLFMIYILNLMNLEYKISQMWFLMFLMFYFGLPPLVSFYVKYLLTSSIKMLFMMILLLMTLMNMFIIWSWIYMMNLNMLMYKKNTCFFYTLMCLNSLWYLFY